MNARAGLASSSPSIASNSRPAPVLQSEVVAGVAAPLAGAGLVCLVGAAVTVFAHPAVPLGVLAGLVVGPGPVGAAAAREVVVAFGGEPGYPVGKPAAVGCRGDLVDGLGPVVAAGDGAHEFGSLVAVTAAGLVYTGGRFGVFVVAFPGDLVVDEYAVHFAAAGQARVQRFAVGARADDGVCGLPGVTLFGLQRDGIPMVDVFT